MQGALAYSWPHDSCNKHFVTVWKRGVFFKRGSSANTKWSMFSVVETFYSGGKIRNKWMWGRLHFLYSLVQMFPITLVNHPIFATPLRKAFTFIWNTWVTKSGWSQAVWLGSSSTTISSQFGLQVNVRKTSGIPLFRIITITSWYAYIMKHGEPRNEIGKIICWPTCTRSNRTSCSTISTGPW